MILHKKQAYLNKVLSKHYKKLRYTLLSETKNIPALKMAAISMPSKQSIGISVLTIGSISHKDFPEIVDVTALNGLKKVKKAVIIYKGKTTLPTILTRSIRKLAQGHFKSQKLEKEANNNQSSLVKPRTHLGTLGVIDQMLGAGIHMHNYKLYFNSPLSLQHLDFLKCKQKVKLRNLDRLSASLIGPQRNSEAKPKDPKTPNWAPLKKKEVRLSKMELSSVIAQVLYKIRFFKGQKSLGESVFNGKKLSNVLGALVEINSKIYFITDKELKQCGLAGGLKHSIFHPSTNSSGMTDTTSLLRDLVYFKTPKENRILLETKCIQTNTVFFNFLNIVTLSYVKNIKRLLSKLINTLSLYACYQKSNTK